MEVMRSVFRNSPLRNSVIEHNHHMTVRHPYCSPENIQC